MTPPDELLANPKVRKKLTEAVTLLRNGGHLEASAFLAVLLSDPRGPEIWASMEVDLEKDWS